MALETASYVANLVVTNPDGGDARSTADDHIRLIKAALRRTFPNLDGAVSLSAAQVHYIGDLSASVQAQLNALRDGSATANSALYANSASVAAFIGTLPAARVPDLQALNVWTANNEVFRFTGSGAYFSWYTGPTLNGYIQIDTNTMDVGTSSALPLRLLSSGVVRVTINADGTVTVPGLISGTITNAQNATNATTSNLADFATNATFATDANFANTCTSASSAATLTGLAPATAATASTVALRNSAGDLFARYFNTGASTDNNIPSHIAAITSSDGYLRPMTPAYLGAYLSTINVTGKTGTAKTLASGVGPPSLVGSTNGDIFYYY
jgi:hypothetical protein